MAPLTEALAALAVRGAEGGGAVRARALPGFRPGAAGVLGGSIKCFLDAITTHVEPMRAGRLRGMPPPAPRVPLRPGVLPRKRAARMARIEIT